MEKKEQKALRYNTDKTQLSLVSPHLIEEIGKVLSFGATKYTTIDELGISHSGKNNYLKGMSWSKVIDSFDRHWNDFKNGVDFDKDSKLSTLGHLGCNLQFLIDYVHYCPELDDRLTTQLSHRKVGLDIDCVIADFINGWISRYGGEAPTAWSFDRFITERLHSVKDEPDFWKNLNPLFPATDLPVEPVAYVSHRYCDVSVTEEWLDKHNFPVGEVIHVKNTNEKVGVCKELGIELFLDDNFKTFKEFQKQGLLCYLFTAQHNLRYNVGHFRINNIKDLPIYKYQS